MKKLTLFIAVSFLLVLTNCTQKQGIKNRATALSIEKVESENTTAVNDNFSDEKQRKIFADLIKKNTRVNVGSVETLNENEATARLTVQTVPRPFYATFKNIPENEWKEKVPPAAEIKVYNLKLQKIDNEWKIVEQTEALK